MRSRPKLQLFLTPEHPIPGRPLSAELQLESRSETPVDFIALTLRGVERRLRGMSMVGNVPVANYATHTHVALTAKKSARTLSVGRHTVSVRFDLPPDIPPAYFSRTTSIEYEIDVHVSIPWWPDRRERYLVPLTTLPLPEVTPGSTTFCNTEGGPRGKELYIEASLDRTQLEVGSVLTGALSLSNVKYHRIKQVELAFVAGESAVGQSAGAEVLRYTFAVVADPSVLVEGEPIPFRILFPKHATPTFSGSLAAVAWQLEVRAVISLGTDITLYLPLVVSSPSGNESMQRAPRPRVAPIGRERRTLVWAEAARRAHMNNDAEHERMTREVGSVKLAITLEHRGDEGIWSLASLAFPAIGLDLQVTERRWVDALKRELRIDDAAFHHRITVRGREAAQVMAVLSPATRAALLAFEQVALDDEGGLIASKGAAHALDPLLAFVMHALDAARAIDESIMQIPPPARVAPHLPAWRALSERMEARLSPGRPFIVDGTWDREPMELGLRWDEDGVPTSTLIRSRFSHAMPGPNAAAQSTEARALVAAMEADHGSVRIAKALVEATFPPELADPSLLVPQLDRVAALSRAVRGERDGGPYR